MEPVAKGSVLRLLSLLKPEKGPLAVAVGTLLATTGTSLVLPAVSVQRGLWFGGKGGLTTSLPLPPTPLPAT